MKFKTYTMEDALEAIIDYRGKTPKKSDSGIPTLSAKSVKKNHIDYSLCYYISPDEYKRFMVRGFPKIGDVLLTTEAPMGVVARLDRDDVAIAQRLLTLRGKENVLDNEYLLYFLQSSSGQSLLKARETGTTVTGIKQAEFRKIQINVPEISAQKEIGGFLRTLDEKIEINSKINENLLQQAQALFISWFVDYAPFGGKMPDNWENMSVYELADYINGAAFKKNEYADTGIPIIKIVELKNGITDSTQRCCVKKDEKYYIDDRDILFSWSGNPDTSIDTFIWSRGRAILNQHTFRVVSKYDAPAFTFFLLKYLKPQFTHIASNKQTTGLGHVTVADLKRLQFRANASVIAEFDALVMPMFDLIYSKYKEIHQLSNLRDTLLPKLMSGEIDVSNLEL